MLRKGEQKVRKNLGPGWYPKDPAELTKLGIALPLAFLL